jgi:hypothetical protein
MRLLTIAALSIAALSVSVVAPASGVLAEVPQNSAAPPALTQDDVERQHPEWYRQPDQYKPCPASVVFPDRRHACLDGS